MAHELAHVQNRDTLTMTITATLAGAISMLGNFAFFFGGNRDNNNPLGFVGVLVAMIVAPLAAAMRADGDQPHARICRRPARRRDLRPPAVAGLGARARSPRSAERIHNPDAERNPATAHLFIINPLSGERMDNLFSTHPNTENRIARAAGDGAGVGGEPAGSAPTAPRRPRSADEPSRSAARGAGSRSAGAPAEPEQPKSNPWGRNPTGPQRPLVVSRPQSRRASSQNRDDQRRRATSRRPASPRARRRRKLLAAVIDAKTPLDGLTDNDNGHPHYLALDMRDRSAGPRHPGHRAALPRHHRQAAVAARLRTAAAGQRHGAVAHPACRGGADPVPRRARQRRRRPRRHHAKSDPRTARFAALVNGVLRSLARGKDDELAGRRSPRHDDAPDWFAERLDSGLWRGARRRRSWPRIGVEAPVDFTVKSDPERWAERFGGIVLPTGAVRVERLAATGRRPAGLRRRRMVGAGCRRRAAGAAVRRRRRQARRRSLRGARRQDGAAGRWPARRSPPSMPRSNRLARLQANLDRLRLDGRDRRRPISLNCAAGTSCSTRCCSTRPAPRPARCAAIPTCHGRSRRPTSRSSPALQRRLLDSAVKLVKPGGRIVFSNCSLDPLEGEELVRRVSRRNSRCRSPTRSGRARSPASDGFLTDARHAAHHAGRSCSSAIPAISGLDGFFAARFRRIALSDPSNLLNKRAMPAPKIHSRVNF